MKKQAALLALILFLLIAGDRSLAQSAISSPAANWAQSGARVLEVEDLSGSMGKYQLRPFVTGQQKVGEAVYFRLGFQTSQTATLKLPHYYMVTLGKDHGWPRELSYNFHIPFEAAPLLAAEAVALGEPLGGSLLASLVGRRPKPGQKLTSWLETFDDVTFIAKPAPGFPLEMLFPRESREIKGKKPGTMLVLKKTVDGSSVVMEARLLVDGSETLLIRQKWHEDEDWWREYEREVYGRKDLRARLVFPPRQVSGPEPIAKKTRVLPEFRRDPKLRVAAPLLKQNPKLADMLAMLEKATGLKLELDNNLAGHDPDYGHVQFPESSAADVMELARVQQLENGSWEKTNVGYRLSGKSLALRPTALAHSASPPSDDPTDSVPPTSWWLTVVAFAVLVSLLVAAYCLFRRSPHTWWRNSMAFLKSHPKLVITFAAVLLLAAVTYLLWPRLTGYVEQRWIALVNPKIVCDEPEFDFGEVGTGQTVKKAFVLRNEGYKSLEIIEVKPSCGCTVATLPGKVIPPGEEMSLDTTLSLKNMRGKQRHRISITSNDPNTPQLELVFQGTAVSEYELKPPVAHFNPALEGGQATIAIDLLAARPQAAWKIAKLVPSKPELVSVRSEPLENKGYRLHVTLKGAKRGWLYESIRIQTDSASEPEILLPVYAQVVGELSIQPDKVYLRPGQKGAVYWVMVQPGKTQKFKIDRVEAPAASIQADILPIKDKGYSIKLSNLSADPELHGKNLKIWTDVKGMEEILVPFQLLTQAGVAK